MKTTKRISLALAMFFSVLSFGQKKTITGIIVDKSGTPISGVNLIVKGTKNETFTNQDGKYSLQAQKKDKIVFLHQGYKADSVTIRKSDKINFTMKLSSKKSDSTVSIDELRKKAMQISITGTVIDELGYPLPGVEIIIKGTKTSASTDFDGKYSIQVQKGDQLIFSYMGYETDKVIVDKSKKINIKMKESSIILY